MKPEVNLMYMRDLINQKKPFRLHKHSEAQRAKRDEILGVLGNGFPGLSAGRI